MTGRQWDWKLFWDGFWDGVTLGCIWRWLGNQEVDDD